MPSDTQFTFRAETPLRTELEAIAHGLDVKLAVLVRDIITESLPEWRKRAEAEIAKRENLPHGVTADQVDAAINALMRKMILGERLELELHQLLEPKSKALWVILGLLWKDNSSDLEQRAAKKLIDLADDPTLG